VKEFLVMLMVLLLGIAVHAQPQAPVVWGRVHWMGIGNTPNVLHPMVLMGDSLVLAGAVPNQATPPSYCAGVNYSHDNGRTFGLWQCLDTMYWGGIQVYSNFFGCAGRAFALVGGRLERSIDGGTSWQISRPRPQNAYIGWGYASGQYVISIEWYRPSDSTLTYRAATSHDGGATWITGIPLPSVIPQTIGFTDVAVTQDHVLLLCYQQASPWPRVVVSGDRSGENWSPPVVLQGPPQFYANRPFIVGDSTSETAMVSQVVDFGPEYRADLHINRTTDGGQSWEAARNVSSSHPLDAFRATPRPFCRGKLWGIVWEDFWNPDTTQWGVYWRLSANRGKDWYPAQLLGPDVPNMSYSGGQFVGNEVRVYWINEYHDYQAATGIMAEDTSPPDIFVSLVPPDTIRTGDSVWFAAQAWDDDTLSEVRVVVLDSSGQSTTFELSSTGNDQFHGGFVVPHDGLFRFRGEADDFWENVATYPDSGWLSFHTEGWPDAAGPLIPRPSDFSVSVYPNPCNGWPSLMLSPEWLLYGPVEITVYNALGQEVIRQTTTGSSVSFSPDVPAASGTYLLQVSSRQHSARRKFTVLK
jgi:hypothetical protein